MVKAGEVSEIAITDNTIQGTLKKPLETAARSSSPPGGPGAGQGPVPVRRQVPPAWPRTPCCATSSAGAAGGDLCGDLDLRDAQVRRQAGHGRRLHEPQARAKAKVYVGRPTPASASGDVAGVDEAKDELKEVVGFLKDPTAGRPAGHRQDAARQGGGPARRACPSSISGSEFVEMFVGWAPRGVRPLRAGPPGAGDHLHRRARRPGPGRGAFGAMGSHDEKEQTLNQLLVELDGFDSAAAAWCCWRHQPARGPRPGAAARPAASTGQVLVDRPDKRPRAILQVHALKVTSPGRRRRQVAALTRLLRRRPGQPPATRRPWWPPAGRQAATT